MSFLLSNEVKKNKNFSRNLFFFFLFIVLAGITFYPLDQRQSYLPNAQVEPTFAPIGDCVANQNCPTGEPIETPEVANEPNQVTTNTDITSVLKQIIQLLLDILRGTSNCPKPNVTGDYSYETDESGLMTDTTYTDDHRKRKKGKHHKKWGKGKKWGLSKRNCKSKPSQPTTPQPVPQPTEPDTQPTTPQPTEGTGGQTSCGNPGNPGNELGVGKYCTKGGGQCAGTQSPYCALDFKTGVPGICSKPCASNADCGSGAVCSGSGLERGCEPTSCGTTTQ